MTAGGRGGAIERQSVPELVAAELRDQIVEGELTPSDSLPTQPKLAKRFGVSLPSVREALSILQSEGLITVRRGKQGGAVVHQPSVEQTANKMRLLLNFRGVSLEDLSVALKSIEPICAGLCASLPERGSVVEQLEEVHDEARAAVDDPVGFVQWSRRFHEDMVELCGNETLKLVVGTLEDLWSRAEEIWAKRAEREGYFPERAEREAGLHAHDVLLQAIADGDSDEAERVARKHLELGQRYALAENRSPSEP